MNFSSCEDNQGSQPSAICCILAPTMAKLLEWTPDPIRQLVNKWRFKNFQLGRESSSSSIAAFDYYKCIYVHIPKTGGISINDALWGNPGGVHKSIGEYARIFSPQTLEDYFKFTFVRNPWDRLVSAYVFMKSGGQHAADASWAQAHLDGLDDFDSFVRHWVSSQNIYRGIHFIPQADFLKLHGTLAIDFIGRMENIEADFDTVKRQLGLNEAQLAHKNKSARRDYREYYTAKSISIVEEVYREDVELFEYSFD